MKDDTFEDCWRKYLSVYNSFSLDHLWDNKESDVFNMVLIEFTTTEALEASSGEGYRDGLKYEFQNIANKAIENNISPELIHDLTGIDTENINNRELQI